MGMSENTFKAFDVMEDMNVDQYLTAAEISAQWGVDTRTVQNLCRIGKIRGAVKRAGSWFIPKDAPSPLKNNKANSEKLHFIGTKKKIFDSAIELFSQNGVESVSLRDIGDAVEITQSTIYNHFSAKHEILDTIYAYYIEHFRDNLKPAEEVKQLLKNMTKEEFFHTLIFTFESPDAEKYKRMILITKIIYMRLFQDERARDIFLTLMNADVEEYAREIMEYGVSIGAIEAFDTQTYAKFIVGQRHIMGIKAFAAPDYEPGQLEEEARLIKMSAELLPFVAGE